MHRALEPFRADGEAYPAGVDIILMAQPYRAYVKTLLERQNYPTTRRAGGLPERPYDVTGWTLPAQMGVDVKTIARPFDQPAMARLTTATIAPAQVWADRAASYYVVDARGNGGAIAANRLLAAGLSPAWLTGDLDVRGVKFGPGSLVVAAARTAPPVLQKIAAELGLRVDGLTGKLPPGTRPVARSRVGLTSPGSTTSTKAGPGGFSSSTSLNTRTSPMPTCARGICERSSTSSFFRVCHRSVSPAGSLRISCRPNTPVVSGMRGLSR